MKKLLYISILLLLTVTACQPWYEREPLEIYYDDVAQIRLDIDWMNHMEEKPSGMTILLAKDGDSITHTHVSNNVDYAYFRLGAGTYKVLVFNYAFDEFQTMQFLNRRSYNDVEARANDLTSHINGAWDRGIRYMQEPEVIGVALDTFTISRDDIDGQRHFIDYRDREKPDTVSIVRRETVYDMTCRLNVYVRVGGLKFMRSVVGYVSGMADGFQLSRIVRTPEHGPLLLDDWGRRIGTQADVMAEDNRTRSAVTFGGDGDSGDLPGDTTYTDPVYDDDGQVHDWIHAHTITFGMPRGREYADLRLPEHNVLTLCFTLLDGTTRTYTYNVGKLIRYRDNTVDADISGDRGGKISLDRSVQLDLDLVIDAPLDYPQLPYTEDPDAQKGTASSFDVIVDPWFKGDTIDVDWF